MYAVPRPYIKLGWTTFSPLTIFICLPAKRNSPENSACPCKKCNKRLEREGKKKKTRLFLSAAAEILSLHCRALSSITNLSPGLDGHRGALLALLALSASFTLYHANKPKWERAMEMEGLLKKKEEKKEERQENEEWRMRWLQRGNEEMYVASKEGRK